MKHETQDNAASGPNCQRRLVRLTVQERGRFGDAWPDAVEYVNTQSIISVAMLQRKLRIGWITAHGILEAMEREGMVGKFCPGTVGRVVLPNAEVWDGDPKAPPRQ